jgi:hypothetical protein
VLAPTRGRLRRSVPTWGWLLALHFQIVQVVELLCEVLLLGPAALPAVSPVQNQELETERVDLDCRLEADAKVVVVHLVEFGAGVQQADVAGDGEEEVVVERGEFGQFVFEHLRCCFCALTFLLNTSLY